MILVGMYVPKVPAEKKEKVSSDEKLPPLGKDVWILAFSGLILYMIMTVVQTKLSILVLSEKIGTPATVGVVSAILGVGVVVGGIAFFDLFKKMGRYISVLALAIACISTMFWQTRIVQRHWVLLSFALVFLNRSHDVPL